GPKTEQLFIKYLHEAKSIIFNGVMGVVEKNNGRKGSKKIVADLAKYGKKVIVGGGDTIKFLSEEKLINKFGFVSVGGGAMLALLAGEKLPGLEVLKK
ncbi:phosphoglycerate kinase, partial [Candidatus Parcubacteria bacterium]